MRKLISMAHRYRYKRLENKIRSTRESDLEYANSVIKNTPDLHDIIKYAEGGSNSTGAGYIDYVFLYEHILKNRPRAVLECGTGRTTMVMALAMDKLKSSVSNYDPVLISMEDIKEWYDHQVEIFPSERFPFAQIVYSNRVEYKLGLLRGSGYESIPEHDYDFVFIDGPDPVLGSENIWCCNMDFIELVRKSERPILGIVDGRINTQIAYALTFGPDNITCNRSSGLAFVGPVSKRDVLFRTSTKSVRRKLYRAIVRRTGDSIFSNLR